MQEREIHDEVSDAIPLVDLSYQMFYCPSNTLFIIGTDDYSGYLGCWEDRMGIRDFQTDFRDLGELATIALCIEFCETGGKLKFVLD